MTDYEAMCQSRMQWVRDVEYHNVPDLPELAAYARGYLDALRDIKVLHIEATQ